MHQRVNRGHCILVLGGKRGSVKKKENLNAESVDEFFPLVIPEEDGARLEHKRMKGRLGELNLAASHDPRVDRMHFDEISLRKEGGRFEAEKKEREKSSYRGQVGDYLGHPVHNMDRKLRRLHGRETEENRKRRKGPNPQCWAELQFLFPAFLLQDWLVRFTTSFYCCYGLIFTQKTCFSLSERPWNLMVRGHHQPPVCFLPCSSSTSLAFWLSCSE